MSLLSKCLCTVYWVKHAVIEAYMLPAVSLLYADVLIQAGPWIEAGPWLQSGVWLDCTNRNWGLLVKDLQYLLHLFCNKFKYFQLLIKLGNRVSFLGRLWRVIIYGAQMSVRTSVHPQNSIRCFYPLTLCALQIVFTITIINSFYDSDEIWYVGRGRWVMHDGMPCDPHQGQGHETFKVRNSLIFFNFQNLSPLAFLMWAGK